MNFFRSGLLLLFILTNVVFAQEVTVSESITGTIHGLVVDETTQSPLPAVNIIIEGTQLGAAADLKGGFIIEKLPAGSYNLRFRMMGYETRIVPNVVVYPKKTTTIKIEMKE